MARVDVVRSRLENRDPVEFWISRMAVRSHSSYRIVFEQWLEWLRKKPSWAAITATELLIRQSEADDEYKLLELLQEYLNERGDLRHNSKTFIHNVVRSFFLHNRVALPKDRAYRIRSEKPNVAPKLSLDDLRKIVANASLRDQSIILVKWQGLLDNERTMWMGEHLAGPVVEQIRAGKHPVRLDLPGRKGNQQGFYTFIGQDAVDSLIRYFDKERGWPSEGEPIWPKKTWSNRKGGALTFTGFNKMWLRVIRRAGIIPKNGGGDASTRYGYNPHEMRDIAKSLLHTRAKPDGFDMDCVEFWLGHVVDKLGYDKFLKDTAYVEKHYRIAEKHLNILSTPAEGEAVRKQDERISELQAQMRNLQELVENRQAHRDDLATCLYLVRERIGQEKFDEILPEIRKFGAADALVEKKAIEKRRSMAAKQAEA